MTHIFETVRQKGDSITIKIVPGTDTNDVLRYFMDQ